MFSFIFSEDEDIVHEAGDTVQVGKDNVHPFILFWKSSGVLEIPKGSLLKQWCPRGVTKVVRTWDSGSSGICQNPLLASSLLHL